MLVKNRGMNFSTKISFDICKVCSFSSRYCCKTDKYQQTGFNFQDLNSNFNELPEKMQNNWITNNAKEYLL